MGQIRGSAGHAALANWHVNYKVDLALTAAWKHWYGENLQQNADWQLLEDSLLRYFEWSINNDTFKILHSEYE